MVNVIVRHGTGDLAQRTKTELISFLFFVFFFLGIYINLQSGRLVLHFPSCISKETRLIQYTVCVNFIMGRYKSVRLYLSVLMVQFTKRLGRKSVKGLLSAISVGRARLFLISVLALVKWAVSAQPRRGQCTVDPPDIHSLWVSRVGLGRILCLKLDRLHPMCVGLLSCLSLGNP